MGLLADPIADLLGRTLDVHEGHYKPQQRADQLDQHMERELRDKPVSGARECVCTQQSGFAMCTSTEDPSARCFTIQPRSGSP
jgi:hypothetical protein